MQTKFSTLVLALLFLVSCDSAAERQSQPPQDSKSRSSQDRDSSLDRGSFFSTETEETTEQSLRQYVPDYSSKASFDAETILKAAGRAARHENYRAVENLIAEYLKVKPDDPHAYFLRGCARYNSVESNDEEARTDLEKALELGSDNPQVYSFLAQIHLGNHRTQKAFSVLDDGIKRFPKDTHLLRARAALFLTGKDTESALADYDRIIELDGSNGFIYLLRGQLYEKLGRFDKALRDYDLAYLDDTDKNSVHNKAAALKLKAVLLARLNRYGEAISKIDLLMKLQPKDDELYRLRGEYHLAQGHYSKAVDDFTIAIDTAPESAQQAYADRAIAYERLGRSDLAAVDRGRSAKIKNRPAEKPILDN